MAHANIVNNEWVDDNLAPLRHLLFAERVASKFCDEISQLASARDQVPPGWHRIFDRAICSLRAVDCPKRNGIEISEMAFGTGSLHLTTYYGPTDTVVLGILSCLCRRSSSTCQECGRGYGAEYRQSSGTTLCAQCHVYTDLGAELQRWVDENTGNRRYRKRPIIEFESLPINIQLLIPKGQIKSLSLVSGDREITYVTPEDVMALLKTLKIMKRYLDRAG